MFFNGIYKGIMRAREIITPNMTVDNEGNVVSKTSSSDSIESKSAKFGDIPNGNYSEVESNGFLVAKGTAQAYRDEYPSHPWVPAGAQAAPDEANHTIGGVPRRVYCFDGVNIEERLSSSFEIPHDYMYGQPIEVHVHFRPTDNTAGDVKWFFDWELSPVNNGTEGYSKPPEAQNTLSVVESIPADKQYYHVIRAVGVLPDNGYELGMKIGFNIRRTPTDAEDTYGADVILEQVALHVPVDTAGSRERYVK